MPCLDENKAVHYNNLGQNVIIHDHVPHITKCVEEKNTGLKALWLSRKFKRDISSELESRLVIMWLYT